MDSLLEENNKLRKQLLQLHVQNAMIIQSMASFQFEVRQDILRLAKKIPNEGTVGLWLSDANKSERERINGLRDECVIKLKELKSTLEGDKNG